MKNKKCPKVKVKVKTTKVKVKDVSKKKAWPRFFFVLALLVVAATAAFTAIEFFTAPRCGEHCATYISYITHYYKLINPVVVISGSLLVLSILGAIFAPRQPKVKKVKVKKVKKNAPVTVAPAVTAPQFLAKGVFKKKAWPWLFVIAALVTVVVAFIPNIVEFNTASKCGDHCADAYTYITTHYIGLVNLVGIIAGSLILVAIICAIFFVKKRTLTLSASELTYKKGRKVVNIPLNSILSIDFCANGIIVAVPHVKFKFAQLKNKKAIYDALYEQTNAPAGVTTTTVIAPTQSLTALAAPLLANPTLQGKLAYFGKLYEGGLITKQQYDKYVDQSYKADC